MEIEELGEELGVVISCPDLIDDDFGPADDVVVQTESFVDFHCNFYLIISF